MSLTSYRAAPPRDKPLRAFAKNRNQKTETRWPTPEAPIDPVRRLPEKATRAMPLGASGMYQRKAALERPASDLFGVLSGSKRAIPDRNEPEGPLLPELAQKPSFAAKEPQ